MLGELNDGLLTHVIQMLDDMMLEIPQEDVFLCPVDDEATHFKMHESLSSTQHKYPFVALARGEVPQLTELGLIRSPNSVVFDVPVGNPDGSGNVDTVRAAPVKLLYTAYIYTDELEFIDLFIERFILLADSAYEKFSYAPADLNGETLDATIVFGEIETQASSIDDTRESGVSFVLSISLEIDSILTSTITTAKVIEEVTLNAEADVDLGQ